MIAGGGRDIPGAAGDPPATASGTRHPSAGWLEFRSPDSRFHAAWEPFIVLLTVYTMVEAPLTFAFGLPYGAALATASSTVTAVFLLDMSLSFRTWYWQGGVLVTDRRKIALRYLRGPFVIDLVANFPFELTVLLLGVDTIWGVPAAPLVNLTQMLRVVRLVAILRQWNRNLRVPTTVLRVFHLVLTVAIVSHWIACAWYFNWFDQAAEGIAGWAGSLAFADEPLATRYLRSLYWATTTLTTVGYGDITPTNDREIVLAIAVQLAGATLYAYLIGSITALIGSLGARNSVYHDHLDAVRALMARRRVPQALQQEVIGQQEYVWHRTGGHDEAALLNALPRRLRSDIVVHVAADMLDHVPMFRDTSPEFLAALVAALRPELHGPGSYIARAGERAQEMYFITDGAAEILDREGRVYALLSRGDSIGTLATILGEDRTAALRAVEYCDTLMLNRADYLRITSEFPDLREALARNAREQAAQAARMIEDGIVL